MTTQELTGYVRAIVDAKRLYDFVDPEKQTHVCLPRFNCQKGWLIKFEFVGELKKLSLVDPDGGGVITYEPLPMKNDDWFYWNESEGVSKLHKEVEQIIDRINKIEL